jgi:uncharacterized spore protein YtfJ
MDKSQNELILESIPNQTKANQLLTRLFEVARPESVFSEPAVHGDHTVITASEVAVALGVGFGGGGGAASRTGDSNGAKETGKAGDAVSGGGGGGGGTSMSRPVAIISIGPNGVSVEPIVDPTKLGIALLTAVGGVFMASARMRRFRRGRKRF